MYSLFFNRIFSFQTNDFDNIVFALSFVKLFESSALMHISSVKSLLSALRQLSNQCNSLNATGQQTSSISFSVERMILVLQNNLHSEFLILVNSKKEWYYIKIVLNIWKEIVDSRPFINHSSKK